MDSKFKWSNGINYTSLLLSLVKYAPTNTDIKVAKKLEKNPRLFKSENDDVKSLELVLEDLENNNKMVDLVGKGDSSDLYFPADIQEMLDGNLKSTSAVISDNYLIVDLSNFGLNHEPLGIKVFKIYDYDSKENSNEDMIRRSKYV